MTARLFAVALTFLLVAAPLAAAAPPASPTSLPVVSKYAYSELSFTQPSFTELALSGELYVYRYEVRGKQYDADDLGQAYAVSNKYAGEPSGAAFVTEIESAVRSGLDSILSGSFSGATISGITATVDRTTLVPASGNTFDPPVKVALSATVERTREAVGLGTLSDAAIEAAFAAGASVRSDFDLKADPGYRIVYSIAAPGTPETLRFAPGDGVSADGTALVVDIDNLLGGTGERSVSAKLQDPSVVAPTVEDIRSAIDVTMGEIQKGSAGIPIEVDITAEVRALDVNERFPGALPEKVELAFVNAEGVRALKATGALADADVAKANEALLETVRADISRAFGEGAVVTGGLSSDDLAAPASKPYGEDPPLRFAALATTTYEIPGANADDVDLALRIGGAADVELTLFAANGRETTYTIHPPSIGEFTSASGGTVTANGQTATITVPAGETSFPATVAMRGRDVPSFAEPNASIGVTVDLQDLDVTIGKIAGGDFGNLLMEITIFAELGVIEVPDELRGSLPEGLTLDHLSADAIRLLLDRGHITQANLTELESNLLQQVNEKLGAALGGDVPVEGGLEVGSLAASLVQTPISGDSPIVFKATARVSKPLAGGELQPQGAIALYSTSLPLTLPKLEGLDTVYTVILPRGLAVTDIAASGGGAEQSKSSDGRDQIVVTPSDEQAQVTMGMAVTPAFVMIKFWPIVLIVLIVLLLIIGTPVALVVRRKGKAKKEAAKK